MRHAFVWSRALSEERTGVLRVAPTVVPSAAGPVDGVSVSAGTFHGAAALYRKDVEVRLFIDDARALRDDLTRIIDGLEDS